MITVHPATADRFEDLAVILAPQSSGSQACWCLSYRIPNQEFRTLAGARRPARLRRYAEEGTPPGVIAYVDGEPAGWCSVSPRASHHRLVHSRTIPAVDDQPVWSVVCFVVRPAFRRRGLARHLLDGAVGYARSQGVPVLEAYPADPGAGASVQPSPSLAPQVCLNPPALSASPPQRPNPAGRRAG